MIERWKLEMKVFAIINQKGSLGRTTEAVNLGVYSPEDEKVKNIGFS